MSQLGTGTPERRGGGKSPGNVYTVLMFIATAALVLGIIFVWYRGYQLFGSANPFSVVSAG